MDDARLDAAYAARRSDNLAAALDTCRRILAADPNHAGAKSLAGLCMAEAGEVDKGRPWIEQAVAAEPCNWRFLLNLSFLREIEDRLEDAIDAAKQAAASAADRFEPWGRLGELYGKTGDFENAVQAIEKAVELNPAHPGMLLLLAAAAFETGRYDRSASALDRFEGFAPDHPESLRLRTHLARKGNDWDGVAALAGRWLQADPSAEEARTALAEAHAQEEDYHSAVVVYQPLAEAKPLDADRAATFAQYLLSARDFEGAERFYRQALEEQPRHAAAAAGLAWLNIFKGRFEEAAGLARQALDADPNHVDAYAQLLQADPARLSDEDLAQLHRAAMDCAIEQETRATAWFTLGDICHRRDDHDRAFESWTRANALRRAVAEGSANWTYDRKATRTLTDRLIASFDTVAPAVAGAATGPQPIFVVGMPRSGTTLLDSALAGHAEIASGGELPAMPSLLTSFLEWADGARWKGRAIPGPVTREIRARYLRQYADYRIEAARFVTDKNPLNFLSVGLIRQVFPDAPIIHIRRNPLETGFSIFRNNFTKSWPFSNSLADIGHYYGEYARLMAHWGAVFGDSLANVRYEAVVGDFEGELRRLLEYIGVEWDPDCLSYFRNEGIVTTLSSAQVRKPPSRELMSSTAPYLAALQPLRNALERAGVELSEAAI